MLNLCMVGNGGIAAEHMKAFRTIKGVHPLWVISRTLEKAKEFQRDWGFEHSAVDLDEALADRRVDLVVIATPSEQHTSQALHSIQGGKNVIVEIPVGLCFSDAERVATQSSQSRRRVLVCHTMRSFPAIREVRRRVKAEELHLSQIVGYFAIPRRRNQSRVGQRSWIDNLLWHHGCHMVDTALWVLGTNEVAQVSAVVGQSHPQFGMSMDVAIHFRTSAQQVVAHSLTYNTEQFCWELRFIGDEDTLTFRNGQLLNEKGESVVSPTSFLDLTAQNLQMLATLAEGAPSDYDISSVLAAMQVLETAAESIRMLNTSETARVQA
jgi:2-hydroxy-4-carboxymuconate semialdehyde hemiacetal dehydrogenase